MNLKLLAWAFFMFPINIASAQLIDNEKGNVFDDEMFFNESFIRNNQIESVRSESFVKRTSRPMRALVNEEIFHFTEDGRLKKLYKIRELLGKPDTLHVIWEYNQNDELVEKTETDARGFYTIEFGRGEEGRVQEKKFYRIRNKGKTKKEFEPGEEYLVNREKYEYSFPSDTTRVVTTLNNHGLPFKEERIVKNSLGYLLKEQKEYLVSSQRETKTYKYNNNGWITSVLTEHYPEQENEEKQFEYDEFGNLLEIKHLTNGKITHTTELIYDEGMLLHSTIHRELKSNIMNINKYFFTFE